MKDTNASQKRLNILHCMRAPVGGLFRHVLDLAGEQAARGHAVGIVADQTTADALTLSRLKDITPKLALGLSLIPMARLPGRGDIAVSRAVLDVARGLNLDVLHGHGAKGGAYARLAGLGLRIKGRRRVRVFYTPHGGSLHYDAGTLAGRSYLAVEKMLGLLTSGLIFESDYARRTYQARIGAGGTPSRVIPNGVGPADFTPHAPQADAAEFLFIGELRTLKGVDVLLRALGALNRTTPVRAAIVGSGPDEAAFKALAVELGLGERAAFKGAMPAREAFKLGRCLIVPSRAESFPYVVLEAGAAGLPLLATNVGGIPEMVVGTSNRLVPPGDVEALTAAMSRVLADPVAAAQGAAELHEAVARKFTVNAMTEAVLDFYHWALAN